MTSDLIGEKIGRPLMNTHRAFRGIAVFGALLVLVGKVAPLPLRTVPVFERFERLERLSAF